MMLSPAQAAAERLDPLACSPPITLLAFSFLLASTGGKGPWGSGRHLAAFPHNQLTSIPRDPLDLFPHFPPPQQFCGSVRLFPHLVVPLLVSHALPASLMLSLFRCAGSVAGDLVKQQGVSGCFSLPGAAGERGGCSVSHLPQIPGRAASQHPQLSPVP